jgi:hypothetical protein
MHMGKGESHDKREECGGSFHILSFSSQTRVQQILNCSKSSSRLRHCGKGHGHIFQQKFEEDNKKWNLLPSMMTGMKALVH